MKNKKLLIGLLFSVYFVLVLAADPPLVTQVTNAITNDGRLAPGILANVLGSNLVYQDTSSPSSSVNLNSLRGLKLAPVDNKETPVPASVLQALGRDAMGLVSATSTSTSVTINGRPAAILFQDISQLMVHVPYDTPIGPASLQVSVGGTPSNTFSLNISSGAPSIYTDAISGLAIASNSTGQAITPTNPAKTGDEISVQTIGLGATTPLPTAGVPTPATPTFTANNPVTVRFLTNPPVTVTADQATLIPGRVGVYLVQFKMPGGVPTGTVGMQVIVANSTSNSVQFPVQAVSVTPPPPPPTVTCSYAISPNTASVGYGGGTGDFALTTSDPSCTWTASANVPWITVGSSSGTGSVRISYRVTANSDTNSRTGAISVGGLSFTITQDGTPPAVVLPVILLSSHQVSFSAVAGATPPAPQSVSITSSADNFDFSLSASDSWIRVTPGSSTTPDSATITVDSRQLASGTYHGSVSVRASGASNSPERIDVTATITDPPPTGALRLDSDAVNFTWYIGDVLPAPVDVNVTSTGPAIDYRVVPTIISPPGVRWLTVRPTSGTAPATGTPPAPPVELSVDVTQLDQGNYDAALVFTPNNPNIAPLSLPVHIQVQQPIPPQLQPAVSQLIFAFAQGSNPDQQLLTVTNPSDSVIRFNVSTNTSDGNSWLRAPGGRQSADRAQPASVLIVADPSSLQPGSYSGSITITPDNGSPIQVPVSAVVAQASQRIEVSQSSLLFQMEAGSPAAGSDQQLNILKVGSGPMAWNATASTLGGGSWLVLRNPSGVTDDTQLAGSVMNVGIQSLNLPVGLYEGSIQINAPSTQNGPVFVRVQLDVRQKGDIGPVLDQAGLVFTGVSGGSDPAPQTVNVTNLGSSSITYNSIFNPSDSSSGVFATLNPPSGRLGPPSITPGAAAFTQKVTVSVKIAGLPPGIFRGTALFTFPNGVNRLVNVLLVLSPPGSSGSSAENPRLANSCPAQFLTPLLTSVEDRLNVAAGDAVVTQLAIVDDCGRIVTQGAVASLFSNGDSSINLRPLGPGRWGTTWQVQSESQPSVRMNIMALDTSQSVTGNTGLQASLTSIGDDPVAFRDGIGLADNSGNPMTPGALIQISGTRLADRSETAPDPTNLPTSLGGVTVLIGGEQCGLQSVASNQIVAMVPPDAAVNTTLHLVIIRSDRMSLPVSVLVTQPASASSSGIRSSHR